MRQIAVANREARARWILAYVGGNALRRSREVPQPYDRHTQGTYWHMREDTLAYNHGHARAYRGHARAWTRPRTRGHARARTRGRDPVRIQARHIHATKSLELVRAYSRRRFPSHVPELWVRGRFPEHEWEISFLSCHPRMTRRPFPGPGYYPTHRLCDQFVRVQLPDPCVLLFTPARVRASTNPL